MKSVGHKGKCRTEKWDARRIREMQSLTVLSKILRATHETAHLLKYAVGALVNHIPGALQAVDGSGAESRNDGCQCREVVESATFL